MPAMSAKSTLRNSLAGSSDVDLNLDLRQLALSC